VLTEAGALNAWHELRLKRKDIEKLAAAAYHPKDIAAALASGSYLTEGMVIAPCSMKTLSAVAHAHADDLVSRAADVVLKERRRLVILPRETPLNLAHLRNMVAVTEMGAIVFPPVPAFYAKPKSIADMVAHTVARVLDLFGIHSGKLARWQGLDG
jgi:polyprenyl P-hydroxybenzoate/phenylacrylic acid decarboxylase-like protein